MAVHARKRERWLAFPVALAATPAIAWCGTLLPWQAAGVGAGLAILGWAGLWRRRNRIPVLNYHAVTDDAAWLSPLGPGLATRPAHLDAHLADLAREGVQTLFVSEVADALLHPCSSRTRRVALTFDDGFADAWHTLLPLLRKHRLKATLFVNSAMIEPGNAPRDSPVRGYLNRAELRSLAESGLVELQPHGHRHDRLPRSADMHAPAADQLDVWGFMREHPDRPWAWPREASAPHAPLSEQGPALARPAWLPAEGRLETDAEFRQRVREDLQQARNALAGLIPERPVMCWPENQAPPEANLLLRECGYRGSASNRFPGFNRPAKDPAHQIARVAVPDLPGHPALSLWMFRLLIRVWEGRLAAGPALGVLLWFAGRRNRFRPSEPRNSGLPSLGTGQGTVAS